MADITFKVNKRGHPETLRAAQPGNTNTVKQGVHSPRLIAGRAGELEAELAGSLQLSPLQTVALGEACRCMAILEAIDRDLGERGIVERGGKPRYLLNHRARMSRQLDQWLAKLPELAPDPETGPIVGERADYVRALQRIALGHDGSASARDRLAALKELVKLGDKGTSSYLDGPNEDDPELRRGWAEVQHADSAKRLKNAQSGSDGERT